MIKRIAVFFCVIVASVAFPANSGPKPRPEILGVRLGISRDEAHKRLRALGRLEKEESRQQEVWALFRDSSYSHLLIGYSRERNAVRFVTAVAKPGGRGVRYSDVLDMKRARSMGSTNYHKYVLEAPARGNEPAYTVIARGSDPKYLTYYSIEKID